ncbi:hypothetical protein J4410_04460 [Candidatus Woesearchaeota archaeon]|nr:hypothetical protein [Candidatus Woesearchaeota archaeon]
MNVLGLGVATLDLIVQTDALPPLNGKISAQYYSVHPGGNCANTLVALARLGVATSIVTKISNHLFGHYLLSLLGAENVSTLHVQRESDQPSISLVTLVGDNRSIMSCSPFDTSGTVSLENVTLDGADLLYLDGRFVQSARILAQEAHKRKIPVVLDAEKIKKLHAEDLLSYATIVITPENYHEDTTDQTLHTNLDFILAQGPQIVITTLGSQGSVCKTADHYLRTSAQHTQVKDTTGAGDAFIGGFIYAYLSHPEWNLQKKLCFASAVASHKCQYRGAQTGLPRKADLPEFFR